MDDSKVVGYVIAPRSMKTITRYAIINGRGLSIFWRWLSGSYGFRRANALKPGFNTIRTLFKMEARELRCDSRILRY